ncbi:MAG: response regulator transcription factor [Tannerella sp.]|jgi:DNA-binding NarL/FixJ family response regulator|nr:response regulator transcription factor [Tannerella sp.]
MRSKKKILIVEPSFIITSGLEKVLAESQYFEVIALLNETDSLKNRLASYKPDILIMNPTLFVDSNNYSIRRIKNEYPKTVLVALVYQYVEISALNLFHGILDIRERKSVINETINEIYFSVNTEEQHHDEKNSYELSKREINILILIAKGLMNKEIAGRLNISVHTVISHRKNITRKTNIKSAAGLTMYALMNNLVEDGNL